MGNWTNNYFRAFRISRALSIIAPLVAMPMFVLDTYDYIELEVTEVSILFSLIMTASFIFTIIFARRDSSVFFLSFFQSFSAVVYFGMFIFFSEPVSGFRENYQAIIMLQVAIYVIVMMGLALKKKFNSAGSFNGKLLIDKKRARIFFTIDSKPTSKQYGKIAIICLALAAIPFIWYFIGVEFYDLPSLGASFLGGIFWFASMGNFIVALIYPYVSRQKELIVTEIGIVETSFMGFIKCLITWDELEKMTSRRIVGINIVITRKTGKYWIKGLSDSSMAFIKSIVKNKWYLDMEGNKSRIIKEAKRLNPEGKDPTEFIDTMASTWEQQERNSEFFKIHRG